MSIADKREREGTYKRNQGDGESEEVIGSGKKRPGQGVRGQNGWNVNACWSGIVRAMGKSWHAGATPPPNIHTHNTLKFHSLIHHSRIAALSDIGLDTRVRARKVWMKWRI